jgi:AbrB family looped-hinge helix DNA binding protein
MVQTKRQRKVIKALAKGQVTIPREFREALGIDAETLLSVSVVGDHLEIAPLRSGDDVLRRYTEEDIARASASTSPNGRLSAPGRCGPKGSRSGPRCIKDTAP